MLLLGERWFVRAVDAIVFIVLARLITPEAFGVVAVGAVTIAVFDVVRDAGLTDAFVQRPTVSKRHLGVVGLAGPTIGAVMALAVVALAGPLADLVDDRDVVTVTRLLAIGLPISGLAAAPTARLLRNLDFAPLAWRGVVSAAAGGTTGIAMALNGFGAGALVGKFLVERTVGCLVLWWGFDRSALLAPTRREFRELVRFGASMSGTRLVNVIARRAGDIVIGASLGTAGLGLYSVASRLLTLVSDVVTRALNRVALPVFSRVSQSRGRLIDGYHTALASVSLVLVPVFTLLAVTAEEVVEVAFGAEWSGAARVAQILAVAGVVTATRNFDDPLLASAGFAGVVFRYRLVVASAHVVGAIIGASTGELEYVAVASLLVAAFVSLPLALWCKRRYLGAPMRSFFGLTGPTVLVAAAAAGITLAVRASLDLGPPAILVVSAAVFGTVYVFGSLVFNREVAASTLTLVRHGLR